MFRARRKVLDLRYDNPCAVSAKPLSPFVKGDLALVPELVQRRSFLRENPCILKRLRRAPRAGLGRRYSWSRSIRNLASSPNLPIRTKLEYYAAVTVVAVLGAIPRSAALAVGRLVAWTTYHLSNDFEGLQLTT